MCTYNGENFLREQLDSIESQDYKNWTLYVNDDGSKDCTIEILKYYKKKWGVKKIIIRRGPQKGPGDRRPEDRIQEGPTRILKFDHGNH